MSVKYLDTVVELKLSQDSYLFSKVRWELMRDWIQERKCKYAPVYDYMNNGIPMVVLMEAQDAVAFKLVFKI